MDGPQTNKNCRLTRCTRDAAAIPHHPRSIDSYIIQNDHDGYILAAFKVGRWVGGRVNWRQTHNRRAVRARAPNPLTNEPTQNPLGL